MKRPAGIRVDAVSKNYRTSSGLVRAIDGVTLEVQPGGSLAITGRSGCGKSTLLGLISGFSFLEQSLDELIKPCLFLL